MDSRVVILERSLRRDAAIRAAGHDPGPEAESLIVRFVIEHQLCKNDGARKWLVERSSSATCRLPPDVFLSTIPPLLEAGYADDAVAIFSPLVGFKVNAEGRELRRRFFENRMHEIGELFDKNKFVHLFPGSWGVFLASLQSKLLEDKHNGDGLECEQDDPFFHYSANRPDRDAWQVVATAIDDGLNDLLSLEESGGFRELADALMQSKWSLAFCQLLVALFDSTEKNTVRSWQHDEAFRLLTNPEALNAHTCSSWRRLLRTSLLPVLTQEERLLMVMAIRQSNQSAYVRTNELSDFDALGILNPEEQTMLENAQRESNIHEPRDSRESRTRSFSFGSFSKDDRTERFITSWPHAEEREMVKLLTEAKVADGNLEEVESSLFPRLAALRQVVRRSEIDSKAWFGESIGWCKDAISGVKKWYRLKHETPDGDDISSSAYVELLETKAPWWEERVIAALRQLSEPVPDHRTTHDSEERYWTSEDPFAGALSFLDEVFAAKDGSRIDVYREELTKEILESWAGWTSYTRGLTIVLLRTYSWSKSASLKELLDSTLLHEIHSRDIEYALHHLLRLGRPGLCRIMRSLLERIDELTDPPEIAYLVGHVIGDAVVRYRGGGQKEQELAEFSAWFDDLVADSSMGKSVRFPLISSIVDGAENHLKSRKALDDAHANIWNQIVVWAIEEWLHLRGDGRELPVLPLNEIRELNWTIMQKARLMEGVIGSVIQIIREACLGGFYRIHYDLRRVLNAKEIGVRFSWIPSDRSLISICRASAERVAGWQMERKSTNDYAYILSLQGNTTHELILLVFDSARDREFVRRELAPVIDVLADAGLRDVASDLRTKLRE